MNRLILAMFIMLIVNAIGCSSMQIEVTKECKENARVKICKTYEEEFVSSDLMKGMKLQ